MDAETQQVVDEFITSAFAAGATVPILRTLAGRTDLDAGQRQVVDLALMRLAERDVAQVSSAPMPAQVVSLASGPADNVSVEVAAPASTPTLDVPATSTVPDSRTGLRPLSAEARRGLSLTHAGRVALADRARRDPVGERAASGRMPEQERRRLLSTFPAGRRLLADDDQTARQGGR